jgi:hypothetical protein
MFIFPLTAGIGIGALLVVSIDLIGRSHRQQSTWRGYQNAVGAGIAVGAMVDLLPVSLDVIKALVDLGIKNFALVPLGVTPNSPLDLTALLLSDLVRPLGGVFILFLYLGANSVPMLVEGRLVGKSAKGWRAWLMIPSVGETDWKGIGLLTIGLAAQNLWLGQVRGALASPDFRSLTTFLLLISAIGALRALALMGALGNPLQRWLLLGLTLIVAAPVVLGVLQPAERNSVLFGVLPPMLATLAVPIALGRLLRQIQVDIGLGWRTTATVLGALALTRLLDSLILMAAQGGLG